VRFTLAKLAWLDLNSAILLKQEFMGRHVAPLGHNILIPIELFIPLTL